MLNIVAIMGRLVYDPELKTTPQGTSVCSFRIACDRNFVSQGQERQADFIDIVVWQKGADFVCKYFQKGSMIAVDGALQSRNYKDKQGNSRTAVEVVANHISFAGPKAAEKPAVHDFDQQTKNYTNEAKAAQNAPQGQQYAQGDADDFIDVTDDGDLPF